MGLEPFEYETAANGLFRRAKVELDDPPGTIALARRLFGDDAVREAWHDGLVDGAKLVYENGRPRIYVRRYIDHALRNYLVGHEVAEWALDCAGYCEDDRERAANAIGAALLLPRRAFLRSFRDHGFDLAELAAQYVAPWGAVALRVGETTDTPVALVTQSRVHRRDPHNELPRDLDLKRLARQTLDPWDSLAFVACCDAPGTFAVRPVFER